MHVVLFELMVLVEGDTSEKAGLETTNANGQLINDLRPNQTDGALLCPTGRGQAQRFKTRVTLSGIVLAHFHVSP